MNKNLDLLKVVRKNKTYSPNDGLMVMNPRVESVRNHLKLKQTKEKNQRFQLSFVKLGFYFKGDEQKKV